MAALFSKLARNRSCRNIHCFDQNFKPGNITPEDLVLMIEHLVAMSLSYGLCNMCYIVGIYRGRQNCYARVVRSII